MRVDGPQTAQDSRIHHPRPPSGARFGVDGGAAGTSVSPISASAGLALVSPSAQAALLDWQADAPQLGTTLDTGATAAGAPTTPRDT